MEQQSPKEYFSVHEEAECFPCPHDNGGENSNPLFPWFPKSQVLYRWQTQFSTSLLIAVPISFSSYNNRIKKNRMDWKMSFAPKESFYPIGSIHLFNIFSSDLYFFLPNEMLAMT